MIPPQHNVLDINIWKTCQIIDQAKNLNELISLSQWKDTMNAIENNLIDMDTTTATWISYHHSKYYSCKIKAINYPRIYGSHHPIPCPNCKDHVDTNEHISLCPTHKYNLI